MNTLILIKEHHQMMIGKGFHNIKEREITKHQHVIELIALLCGEIIGESLEAHRCKRFTNWKRFEDIYSGLNCFDWKDTGDNCSLEKMIVKHVEVRALYHTIIKDTHEIEIADSILRIFDLCGYLEIDLIWNNDIEIISTFVPEILLSITQTIIGSGELLKERLSDAYTELILFCKQQNIDIEKHITAKIAYNSTREYKYGKEY